MVLSSLARHRAILIHDGTVSAQNQCDALRQSLGVLSHNSASVHLPFKNTLYRWLPPWLHVLGSIALKDPFFGFDTSSLRLDLASPPPPTTHPTTHSARTCLDRVLEAVLPEVGSREAPRPDAALRQQPLIIACGRSTIPLAASLSYLSKPHLNPCKAQQQQKPYIHIHHPRCGPVLNRLLFGAIVTPLHDFRRSRTTARPYELVEGTTNVIPSVGSLSWVNSEALERARRDWEPSVRRHDEASGTALQTQSHERSPGHRRWPERESNIARPVLVLLVGGPNSKMQLVSEMFDEMVQQVKLAQGEFNSVLVVGSRRTPVKDWDNLVRGLPESALCWAPHCMSADHTPNPYRLALAIGDAFLVTPDSVGMLSDACSTGKRVRVAGLKLQAATGTGQPQAKQRSDIVVFPISGKFGHFVETLVSRRLVDEASCATVPITPHSVTDTQTTGRLQDSELVGRAVTDLLFGGASDTNASDSKSFL